MSEITRDFDIIAPPKRVAKIGGEEVDVSIFPARATLKLMDLVDTPEKQAELESGKNIEALVEVVATACQKSNPRITKDFLLDLDITVLVEFAEYVMEPVKQKMQQKESAGKNRV